MPRGIDDIEYESRLDELVSKLPPVRKAGQNRCIPKH
jgi:hypothetical protein